MNNLQVQNSFEPYYAGRNGDRSNWVVRRRDSEKAEAPRPEKAAPKINGAKPSES